MLTIDIIAPALPPQLDGLGDYSACIAAELTPKCKIRILTVTGHQHHAIPGVEIVPVFDTSDPASVKRLLAPIRERKPDWVILQYNPFSYGHRGYNPYLPAVLRQIKREVRQTRIAVMAHENFVPFDSLKGMIMNTWQCPQFFVIGRTADVLFLPIQPWVETFRKWFPSNPPLHLPVGSNFPRLSITREEAKKRLGLAPQEMVLGVFGQAHISRLFDWIAAAFHATKAQIPETTLLYIGPSRDMVEAAVLAQGKGDRLILEGPFPPDEVSRRLSAIDIMLTPYADGVSARRGVFMAGIQHGLPTVGTYGIHTDKMLLAENNRSYILTPATDRDLFVQTVLRTAQDKELRERLGPTAVHYYNETFSWEAVAAKMLSILQAAPKR